MRDHLSWETTTCSGHYIQVSLYIPKTKALSMHYKVSLQWRHNGHNSISNHQLHDCLLNRLFRRRSKETSKHRVTGLCAGNSPGTGEFPAQMASNAENASIWWHHHVGLPNWTSLFRYFSDHLLNMTFSFDRHCHSLATAAPNEYEHDQINLTHLPPVPHICVIELGQHWFRWWLVAYSVPSHYLNQCWIGLDWICLTTTHVLQDILSIGPLETNFSGILIQIQNLTFMKMHLKMSAKWWPFCSGGDE